MIEDVSIFILTLQGDDQRRQPLLNRLRDLSLTVELHFGLNGRNGLSPKYECMIDRAASRQIEGRDLSDGEYACALSHRMIYQKIVEEELPYAVILEDDAIVADGLLTFMQEREFNRGRMILLDCGFGRALPLVKRRLKYCTLRRYANQPSMANAYSISNSAAQQLLQATTPVRATVDWPTSLYNLAAWLADPRLVRHHAPGSGNSSHLEKQRAQRSRCADPRRIPGMEGLMPWLRRRISVRSGRAKGER